MNQLALLKSSTPNAKRRNKTYQTHDQTVTDIAEVVLASLMMNLAESKQEVLHRCETGNLSWISPVNQHQMS